MVQIGAIELEHGKRETKEGKKEERRKENYIISSFK